MGLWVNIDLQELSTLADGSIVVAGIGGDGANLRSSSGLGYQCGLEAEVGM